MQHIVALDFENGFSCTSFIMFPSLQILNLNGNMITQMSLDTCIDICGEIPEITQLHLSDNHLTEIPKIAFQFAKLTLLDLR